MLTVGEAIDRGLRFYTSAGSSTVTTDQSLRDRARYFLTQIGQKVRYRAPWWFRLNESLNMVVTGGTNPKLQAPADFSHFGVDGQVYVTGLTLPPLRWMAPDELGGLRNANAQQVATPIGYSLQGKSAGGVPFIQIYPNLVANVNLDVRGYVTKALDMVDRPGAPTVAAGAAGVLNGSYQWLVTFVTAAGETEGGVVSTSLTLTNQKGALTAIPTSPCHSVTARNIYRTVAGGVAFLLAGTVSDNVTTTFMDNTADGSLGVAVPTAASGAVTGFEQYPDDMIESVFCSGLEAAMARSAGDVRDSKWMDDVDKEVRRFWGEFRQGQNRTQAMPRYGAISGTGSAFRRWSVLR